MPISHAVAQSCQRWVCSCIGAWQCIDRRARDAPSTWHITTSSTAGDAPVRVHARLLTDRLIGSVVKNTEGNKESMNPLIAVPANTMLGILHRIQSAKCKSSIPYLFIVASSIIIIASSSLSSGMIFSLGTFLSISTIELIISINVHNPCKTYYTC
jgi:hypothetical protein